MLLVALGSEGDRSTWRSIVGAGASAARFGSPRLFDARRAWAGNAEPGDEWGTLMMAVGLVFAVLALLFRSFRQPAVIPAMAPPSLTGVLAGFAGLSIPSASPR